MKNLNERIFIFVLFFLAFSQSKAFALHDEAEDIFRASKCTKCHSVKSKEISPSEESLGKRKIRDLSGIGLKHQDEEWFKKWLRKEVKNDEGRFHKVKWEGSKDDLEKLVKWLTTLKTEISKEEIEKWYAELEMKLRKR